MFFCNLSYSYTYNSISSVSLSRQNAKKMESDTEKLVCFHFLAFTENYRAM